MGCNKSKAVQEVHYIDGDGQVRMFWVEGGILKGSVDGQAKAVTHDELAANAHRFPQHMKADVEKILKTVSAKGAKPKAEPKAKAKPEIKSIKSSTEEFIKAFTARDLGVIEKLFGSKLKRGSSMQPLESVEVPEYLKNLKHGMMDMCGFTFSKEPVITVGNNQTVVDTELKVDTTLPTWETAVKGMFKGADVIPAQLTLDFDSAGKIASLYWHLAFDTTEPAAAGISAKPMNINAVTEEFLAAFTARDLATIDPLFGTKLVRGSSMQPLESVEVPEYLKNLKHGMMDMCGFTFSKEPVITAGSNQTVVDTELKVDTTLPTWETAVKGMFKGADVIPAQLTLDFDSAGKITSLYWHLAFDTTEPATAGISAKPEFQAGDSGFAKFDAQAKADTFGKVFDKGKPMWEKLGDVLAKEMPTPQKILDIGSGPGEPACYLAERFSCATVSSDSVPPMVEASKKRVAAKGLGDKVESMLLDMMDLSSVEDASVDVVSSAHAYPFAPDKAKALAEAFRVLKLGGVFCAVCWKSFELLPLAGAMMAAVTGAAPAPPPAGAPPPPPVALADVNVCDDLLKAAGFEIAETNDFEEEIPFTIEDLTVAMRYSALPIWDKIATMEADGSVPDAWAKYAQAWPKIAKEKGHISDAGFSIKGVYRIAVAKKPA